jgi:hypothetical protein
LEGGKTLCYTSKTLAVAAMVEGKRALEQPCLAIQIIIGLKDDLGYRREVKKTFVAHACIVF